MELSAAWGPLGYLQDNGPNAPMTVEQAAEAVLVVLTSPVWLRDLTVTSDPGRVSAIY